ncbi:MAG: hypothetical protein OEY29_14505 [Gammaproteobacteria bacterium]|nr:hypothetical protein [Gammaproteobacteria bacterium]
MIIIGFILGILLFPLLIFLRARRDPQWDNSNITNIYRLIAHIATHPNDFTKMRYIGTGKDPFWYLGKDEFSEVTKTRP